MVDAVEHTSAPLQPGAGQSGADPGASGIEPEQVLRRRAEALSALQATVLDITVRRDLPSLLETIVERATHLLNTHGGGLYLFELPEGQARCVVGYNTARDYRGTVLPRGVGAAGRVAHTGESLIVDDYATWEGRAHVFDEASPEPGERHAPFGPVLAVPMVWQGQVIGVIDVFRLQGDPAFDDKDCNLLRLFADHAAIAVENTRLYDQVQGELAKRQRLEQQGEERSAYLERLIACTPDAVVTLDGSHRVREWNPGAARLFGYTREEAIGANLDTLIAGSDPVRHREAADLTRRTLAGESISPTETVRYRRDGTPVTVIVAGSPIVLEAGSGLQAGEARSQAVTGAIAVYTDITAHKEARQALAESEERHRTLVENLPIGVYRTSPGDHGTFLVANRAFLHMFGFESEQDLAGLNVSDLYANRAERRAFSEAVLKEGSVSGIELQLKRADGTTLWGSVTAKAVIDEVTGEVAWFDCTIEDVTRRKRALEIQGLIYRIAGAVHLTRDERALFETIRRELGTFLDTRNLFVALYDAENDEITLPYFVDEHDRFRTFPAGKTLTAYVIRNNRSLLAHEEEMRQLEEAGEIELVGTPSKVWLGVPLEASGDPSLYSGQGVVGALVVQSYTDPAGYGRDEQEVLEFVSGQIGLAIERVRAEKELRRLKEFNEGIVQNVAEGIVLQDACGYFTFVNPAAAEMLGYDASPSSANTLVGEHWTRLVPEDQHPIVAAADRRRVAGEADRYQVEMMRRDGSRFPVLISGSPRFDDGDLVPGRYTPRGRLVGTLAVFTDISERVAAEEKLARHAQEMAALYETSLEINSQPNLSTLLLAIVQRAARLVDVRMGGLYLVKPGGQALELVVSHNLPSEPVGTILALGEGLSGRIAETGEPLMVTNYQEWNGRADVYAGKPFRRVLGVPMKAGERMLGVINLTDDRCVGDFTADEVRLASLFADQAAIAVENARLFEAEARRRREADTLRIATQALSATLDLQKVLGLILSELQQVVPYDSASVQQLRHNEAALGSGGAGEMVVIAGVGFPNVDDLVGVSFDLKADDNPNNRVARSRAPVILDDAPASYAEFRRDPHLAAGIRSWLGVPLLFGDRLIGMIALDKREPGFYTDEYAELAQSFAAQASVALANAQLFGFVEQAKRDWETTFDAMQDPVVLVDAGGRVSRANLAFARLVGRPVHQVVGEMYAAVLGAGTDGTRVGGCTRLECALDDVAGSGPQPPGTGVRMATCVHRYQGRVFEVQATSQGGDARLHSAQTGSLQALQATDRATESDQDRAVRVIYAMRDITERKRVEEEIQRRNRELSLLNRVVAAAAARRPVETILATICEELARAFDVTHVTAWLLGREGAERVVSVSATVAAAWSRSGAHTARAAKIALDAAGDGRHLLELRTAMVMDDGVSGAAPGTGAARRLLRWPDGASGLLVPLVVEGEVVGHLEMMVEVGRRFGLEEIGLAQRVAEQAAGAIARARLEETERRLSAAVEQAAEAVIITDTGSTILYANPALEQITGLKRSDVVGTSPRRVQDTDPAPGTPWASTLWASAFRATNNSASHHKLWEMVSADEVWQGRVAGSRPDGTPFVVDMTVTPVRAADGASDAGEIVNHVATMRDVTREVQLEEQFQQSQKMEALGRLAGGIAHDFNNLLTVIHLSTRLLERQLRPEDPLWEHVQHIRQTGERAAKLTKQLLSFSRREVIDPQVVSMNRIVGDLGRMLQRIIGEDVQLATDLQPELWAVQVDPAQMEQVLMNLVVNARDAMPHGGTLTIKTRNVTLDPAYAAFHVEANPGAHVLLSVTDTGEGMDAEVKSHLFEPFFTTKQRGQGTGLGLSTVFGIIKQSGGHIRVDSEPGEGTSINIYLPRSLDADVPAAVSPRMPTTFGTTDADQVVLVVEDDTAVRTLATRVLQSYGCRVLQAGNGAEALVVSREYAGRIDLLLTDVVMPVMDGKRLADELQALRPEMAVLYMSGYADDILVQTNPSRADPSTSRADPSTAWADGLPPDAVFMSKPFTVEDLVQKVQGAFRAQALRRTPQG